MAARPMLCALVLAMPWPARADGPGPSTFDEIGGAISRQAPQVDGRPVRPVGPRPARRVMGGSDYVGSDYGLGKPSYFGLGSRPDWGRSNTD